MQLPAAPFGGGEGEGLSAGGEGDGDGSAGFGDDDGEGATAGDGLGRAGGATMSLSSGTVLPHSRKGPLLAADKLRT